MFRGNLTNTIIVNMHGQIFVRITEGVLHRPRMNDLEYEHHKLQRRLVDGPRMNH